MNSHEQERLFKRLRDDLIDASRKLVDAGAKITDRPPEFMEGLGMVMSVADFCDTLIPRPLNEIVDLPVFVEDPNADKPAERWL